MTETTTVTVRESRTPERLSGRPGSGSSSATSRSLARTGDRYEMRFDPALLLSGETANTAAAEDGVVEPGEPVPNDNYVVDESPRAYTYLVADDAKVTGPRQEQPGAVGPDDGDPRRAGRDPRRDERRSSCSSRSTPVSGSRSTSTRCRSVYQQYQP